MCKLNQQLLRIRVWHYNLFYAKDVRGTYHFITTLDEGLEIMEKLRGYTSGLAVPTYIINAPNGRGEVPVLPNYILRADGTSVRLRNWKNHEIECTIIPEDDERA